MLLKKKCCVFVARGPSPITFVSDFAIQVVNFGQNASRGKNASKVVVKTTRDAQFQLLHLSVLREYVWAEFTRDVPEETVRPTGVHHSSPQCKDR